MKTKQCKKCAKEKELSEFYNSTSNKDGKYTICKQCLREERYSIYHLKWKVDKYICKICGEEFYKKTHNQIYCSDECRAETQRLEYRIKNGSSYYKMRFEIFKRDNFTCQYCGRKAPEVELHVDHIVPRMGESYKETNNSPENLTTACKECNLGKADVLLSMKYDFDKNKNA